MKISLNKTGLLLIVLITTILVSISSRESFQKTDLDSQNINYGSLVKFFHPQTAFMLHSHGVRFGPGGVFSVTGYKYDDHGSYWQLNQKLNSKTKTVKDYIKCGDMATVKSVIMNYFLRTQQTAVGLTSQLNQVIQGQTRQGVIDNRVNWQLICDNKQFGQNIVYGDYIRLKHENTGKYASLSRQFIYNQANCGRGCIIANQLQPHAIQQSQDDRSVFQIVGAMNYDNLKLETKEQIKQQ